MQYESVYEFWFQELKPEQRFKKDPQLDRQMRERFFDLHRAATQGELFPWRQSVRGRLCEIIVLDQFSRNIFRDRAEAFAFDPMALVLAQEAVALKVDSELNAVEKQFLYMPYMHSESLQIHDVAVKLFSAPGLEYSLDFENRHRDIIVRFGRYPHRNAILGRASTAEELDFLKGPNSGF